MQPTSADHHLVDSSEGHFEHSAGHALTAIPAAMRVPWSRTEKIFVLVASTLFAMLCIGSIRMESVTDNEMIPLPAGLSYLQRFDARMNMEHPPLIKMIAAV